LLLVPASLLLGSGLDIKGSLSALSGQSAASRIIWNIRLPRIALALVCGSVLAVCGAAMQGLFKNPLCDPHILGVSSGAGLGAAVAMALGLHGFSAGLAPVTVFAFGFSMLSIFLVTSVSRVGGRSGDLSLLLSGLAVSALMTAGVMLVMRLNRDKMENIIYWTMGSFSSAGWRQTVTCLPLSIAGSAGLLLHSRELDMLSQGEEWAASGGVNVQRTRALVLVSASAATASVVSVSGVIGFVGLMVPHVIRLLFGPSHKSLMPLSMLAGGFFLLLMDTLARSLAAPMEIPVGILTALCGAPFFLFLLRKKVAADYD